MLVKKRIKWKLNLPSVPHHGGVREHGVPSCTHRLLRGLGQPPYFVSRQRPTFWNNALMLDRNYPRLLTLPTWMHLHSTMFLWELLKLITDLLSASSRPSKVVCSRPSVFRRNLESMDQRVCCDAQSPFEVVESL